MRTFKKDGNYEVGELVFDSNSNTNFTVVRNKVIEYIILKAEDKLSLKQNKTFQVGTKYIQLINVQKLQEGKRSLINGFYQHNASVALQRTANGYSTYAPYGGLELTVKLLNGDIQDQKHLLLGAWYVFEGTFTEPRKILEDEQRGVDIPFQLLGETEVWVADFELDSEKFNSDFQGLFGNNFESKFPLQKGVATEPNVYRNMLHRGKYALEIPNGIAGISPQMLGYPTFTKPTTTCVSKYLQLCLDSDYDVIVPNNFYYISEPVFWKKIKLVTCYGNRGYFKQEYAGYAQCAEFWSDKNISFVFLQNFGLKWVGGFFNSQPITAHNKGFFEIDLNYKTGHIRIENVFMEGDVKTLLQTRKGTKGIWMNLAVEQNSMGHTYNNYFSGYAAFLDSSVDASGANEHWRSNSSNFINLIHTDIDAWGCKKPIHLLDGGSNSIKCRHQSEPVLNPEEFGTYAFTIKGDDNILDLHMGDNMRVEEGDISRHLQFVLDAPGYRNTLVGRTYNNSPANLAGIDFQRANKNAIIGNPKDYYLGSNGIISDLHNVVRYANDFGNVKYRGFLAPNIEWFEENLKTDLTENKSSCVVEWSDYLLTSKPILMTPRHSIKNELGFAEIEIKMPTYEDVYSLKIDMTGINCRHQYIQIIGEDDKGVLHSKMIIGFTLNGSAPLPIDHFRNLNIGVIKLRFIGTTNLNGSVLIQDVAIIQKGNNDSPVLNISNQTQRKTGLMIFEKVAVASSKGYSELVSREELEERIKELDKKLK